MDDKGAVILNFVLAPLIGFAICVAWVHSSNFDPEYLKGPLAGIIFLAVTLLFLAPAWLTGYNILARKQNKVLQLRSEVNAILNRRNIAVGDLTNISDQAGNLLWCFIF